MNRPTPKYKIWDRVWTFVRGKIAEGEITAVVAFETAKEGWAIEYLVDSGEIIEGPIVESAIFPTKEELIASL